MALRLIDQYPAQVAPVDANYTHGAPRNVSAPSAGDGTPWEEAYQKDIYGFLSALIDAAAIVHSGSADTAIASQYLQALQALFLQTTQLESAGGTILETTSRLTTTGLEALRVVRDSATLFTTNPGRGRHIIADDAESILVAALQKDISATWSLGAAGGAVPAALHPIAANQMIRLGIVSKPDGTADIAVDTSPTFANFFADAAAIAAGFSDATRYRRFGYLHIDGSNQLTDFVNLELDPRRYLWAVPSNVDFTAALVSANRVSVNFGDEIPPSCLGRLTLALDFNAVDTYVLLTNASQTDSLPTDVLHTLFASSGANGEVSGSIDFEVDSSQDLFVRKSAGSTNTKHTAIVHGWVDPGIVA